MTDDPCDELDEAVRREIWARLLIDRSPIPMRTISLITQVFGRASRPVDPRDHPHDQWQL